MKTAKQRRNVSVATLSDDDLLVHVRAVNIWDCIVLGAPTSVTHSTRVFNNTNIGQLHLTNLQVPGQMPGGGFVTTNWYARHNIQIPEHEPYAKAYLDRFIANTYLTYTIGDRPTWCRPLVDLLAPTLRAPLWPVVVPSHQNFNVTFESFSSSTDPLNQYLEGLRERTPYYGSHNVWVHLEGLLVPRELWIPEDVAEDDPSVQARWLALQAKVLRLVTGVKKSHVDTADHIARWVRQLADDDQPDEIKAQLAAIADGISEHRYANALQAADRDTLTGAITEPTAE